MNHFQVTSNAFVNNGAIPKKYTGFGEDISPEFNLKNVCAEAVSIAIIMDDLDVPFVKAFNHWVVWNIPKTDVITENIKYGERTDNPKGAVQGIGWGKNGYRGPKQPPFIHKAHRYVFQFYVLDTMLGIGANSTKKELLKAMDGHILQCAEITGVYKP